MAPASKSSNTVKDLLPWLRPPRAALLCRVSYLGSGLQEQHYCEESPTLAPDSKSSITVKNLLPWLRPPRAVVLRRISYLGSGLQEKPHSREMARGCTHGQSLGSILVSVGGIHSPASSSTKKLFCAPEYLNNSQIKNKTNNQQIQYELGTRCNFFCGSLKRIISIKTKTTEL